jgi:drug/metabolite transporter (DMT)-like permease
VVARPLAETINSTFLSGITNWSAAAWGGWLFLVVFGSLVAFTAYLRLIAVWGPARAGSYAYVSPVIAVLLGVVLLHEHLALRDGSE